MKSLPIEKIVKCLRLAQDQEGTPEGDAALRQAEFLQKKYGVSDEEILIALTPTTTRDGVVLCVWRHPSNEGPLSLGYWRRDLLTLACRLRGLEEPIHSLDKESPVSVLQGIKEEFVDSIEWYRSAQWEISRRARSWVTLSSLPHIEKRKKVSRGRRIAYSGQYQEHAYQDFCQTCVGVLFKTYGIRSGGLLFARVSLDDLSARIDPIRAMVIQDDHPPPDYLPVEGLEGVPSSIPTPSWFQDSSWTHSSNTCDDST